jgi:hypothetical protein
MRADPKRDTLLNLRLYGLMVDARCVSGAPLFRLQSSNPGTRSSSAETPSTGQRFLVARACADDEKDLSSILRLLAEGRKKGQSMGALANRAKGERFREVIVMLARDLWERKPELINNMSATAREIESQKKRTARCSKLYTFGNSPRGALTSTKQRIR